MAKRSTLRSASSRSRCRKCGVGRLERETTIKGGTSTVQWRCTSCEAVYPATKRRASS